tara:strand:+ start:131 stop:328 length:198 start_codon:yes stop_codon:yes gene_type:complete
MSTLKENIKFINLTPTELSCLLDMIEQNIEDNNESIGKLHRETLKAIHKKLAISINSINKKHHNK